MFYPTLCNNLTFWENTLCCTWKCKLSFKKHGIPPHIHQDGYYQKIPENNKSCEWCEEIRTLVHYWWKHRMVQTLWKAVWCFLRILKMKLLYDSAILLLRIYPKEYWRNICTPIFIAALFTIAKRWMQPKCSSMDEWMNKMWYIHTMWYYSALRRKEILTHATTQMNLESIMLSEISQSQKDKYCTIPFIWGT